MNKKTVSLVLSLLAGFFNHDIWWLLLFVIGFSTLYLYIMLGDNSEETNIEMGVMLN